MGLMFLGGFLAAAACACLVRRWTSGPWKWIAMLVSLLSPVVFWQISAAGAPDLWMAFFATTGVLVISRAKELPRSAHAILAGALAGGVAGNKYTGCIIAASMAVAFFWEARSSIGRLRFFPAPGRRHLALCKKFCLDRRSDVSLYDAVARAEKVNAFALASYRADTGAGAHNNAWMFLKFLFFAE